MPRFLRICLMVFGPAPLALLSLWIVALADELVDVLFSRPGDSINVLSSFLPRDEKTLFLVILGLVITCIITAIPSILYAAAMEFAIMEGLDPKSWKLVGVSTLLGALCGLCIGVLQYHFLPQMLLLGAWVGFVIGLLMRFMPERLRFRRRSRETRTRRREIVRG